MENVSSACTHFCFDLFKKINENNSTGNLFFSPISISSALAMVFLGTKGKSAQQLSKTLHFNDVKDLHSTFQALNAEINKENSMYALNLANRLFGEKTFSFLPDFLSSIKKQYNADLGTVDFFSAAEDARKEINKWGSEQTKGKIPEVLPAGAVDCMTRLVLVNAIYFKGNWATQFNAKDTRDMPFQFNKKEQKVVKMMYQKEKLPFNYIPEIKCRILELPYVGYEISMIIILPDNINDDTTGLQQLEKELSLEKINKWTKNMMSAEVKIHLPKFTLKDSYKLKSQLAGMGMWDIFDAVSADLTGMSASNDLFLSEVIHKSFVEVNEEGTEAAVHTSAEIAQNCMTMEFNADHPFLFLIRHNATKSILFFGRYSSP
ncbi:leukocyte elastase inhibitor-like [Xenopus laevis]|uniref:Leukocyte elastase inhibitor n=2 Tax=Xenopus laevis TaxID=8355 RepID=A0A1L8FS87_XENLA|nr:leukocyte elastase inhibitor-like [Xenopus laevis]OCT74464.1 hypothetical protein XELAEV_18033443mg [Xenopus laevis]